MTKTPHTDKKYIDALLRNDAQLIEELYQKWHKEVLNFVKKNNGNEQDADDLFQESLMTIIRRARKGDFVLTVPFGGYFYFIYKNRWLDKLRKNDKEQVIKTEVGRYNNESETIAFDTSINEERYQLYKKYFEQLSENCRQLLSLTFQKISRKKIMERLGYASENSTNQRIHRCRGNLQELVKQDPAYQQLKAAINPNKNIKT